MSLADEYLWFSTYQISHKRPWQQTGLTNKYPFNIGSPHTLKDASQPYDVWFPLSDEMPCVCKCPNEEEWLGQVNASKQQEVYPGRPRRRRACEYLSSQVDEILPRAIELQQNWSCTTGFFSLHLPWSTIISEGTETTSIVRWYEKSHLF